MKTPIGRIAPFALLFSTACAISVKREVELGNQYAAQLARELPLVADPAVQQAIDEFMQPILAHTTRPELPWTVNVVNAEMVNAFAVPGGHLYVTRGLIEAARSYDELAGVMGHEMAHVDLRHSMDQLQKATVAETGVTVGYVLLGREPGDVEQAALNVTAAAVFAKFSRDDEREADRASVAYMTRAGINPEGLIRMFETLAGLQEGRPGVVEQFFASHPLTDDRIADVRALIATDPAALHAVRTGVRDRPIFARLQSLVRRLPPPPPPGKQRPAETQ